MDKRMKIFVLINILIIISTLFFINYINNRTKDKLMEYSEILAEKFGKYIVLQATTNKLKDIDEMFIITRRTTGEITSIDYNAVTVNNAVNQIVELISMKINELENGNSTVVDLSKNLLLNESIKDYRGGIIVEIPTGLASGNFLLNNLGPKMPIKISLTGEIAYSVHTSITEYGINNALVAISVNIEVSEQILMPLTTKKVVTKVKIPLSINIIQGIIPNYYVNDKQTDSVTNRGIIPQQ